MVVLSLVLRLHVDGWMDIQTLKVDRCNFCKFSMQTYQVVIDFL
jgi:hypothetical protein